MARAARSYPCVHGCPSERRTTQRERPCERASHVAAAAARGPEAVAKSLPGSGALGFPFMHDLKRSFPPVTRVWNGVVRTSRKTWRLWNRRDHWPSRSGVNPGWPGARRVGCTTRPDIGSRPEVKRTWRAAVVLAVSGGALGRDGGWCFGGKWTGPFVRPADRRGLEGRRDFRSGRTWDEGTLPSSPEK
jgi:hypothetical protein